MAETSTDEALTSLDAPVLLYDGVCGFCNESVQLILKSDRRGEMRFAALQSEFGRQVVERHPELQGVDSVVYLDRRGGGEQVFIRSEAALLVAEYLGGFWKIFLLARLIPRPLRDFFYNLFARNRYKLFGKYDTCLLPSAEVRSRFIDI